MADSVAYKVSLLVEQLHTIGALLRQVPQLVADDPRLVVDLGEERPIGALHKRVRPREDAREEQAGA